MARELGQFRWLEVLTTGPSTYTKLCTVDSALNREIKFDDVSDNCSDGNNEQEAVEKMYKIDASGKYKSDNVAYAALCTNIDTLQPGDAGFASIAVKYVTTLWTFTGTMVYGLSEAAPNGALVTFSLTNAQFTGAVVRTAS